MSFFFLVVGPNLPFVLGWWELAALYCADVLLVLVSLVVRPFALSAVGSVKMFHEGTSSRKLLLAEFALSHHDRSFSSIVLSSH